MIWAAVLACGAAAAAVAFHMVRPRARRLRVSVARFLPDPPASRSPDMRLSFTAPLRSPRFALRVVLFGLVAVCLIGALPSGQAPTAEAAAGLRVVVDVTPSMGLPDGGGTRLDAARDAVRRALAELSAGAPPCVELIAAGADVVPVLRGGPEAVVAALAALSPSRDGRGVDGLLNALALPSQDGCGIARALVVSDRVAEPLPEDAALGPVVWWTVGEAVANAALLDASPTPALVTGGDARLRVRAAVHGPAERAPELAVSDAEGERRVTLGPDPKASGAWSADVPLRTAGEVVLRLVDASGWDGDDALSVELAAAGGLVLDWRLDAPPPRGLRPMLAPGAAEVAGAVAVISAAELAADPPDRPYLAVQQAVPAPSAIAVGPFLHEHPILDGLDFDVFEAAPPAPLQAEGVDLAVLRPGDGRAGLWVGVSEAPRGALVPAAWSDDPDARAAATLLFFNALRWVAAGTETVAAARRLGADGGRIDRPLDESATFRTPPPEPDLAPLAAPGTVDGWTHAADGPGAERWALPLAAALLLIERGAGFFWTRRERAT